MADVNPKVMQMIEAELKKNPDISNKELFEKAKSVDKSVGKLNARQFNARYPLQVKRAMSPKKPRARKKAAGKKAGASRKTTRKGATGAKRKAGRKAGRSRASAPKSAAKSAPGRDRVRGVLLDFAREVANAQGKGDLVDVIAGIDKYVDRVVKAVG